MMVLLILVNSTNVLSMLKTHGELKTVLDLVISIVIVHSMLPIVMVLGIVMISTMLLKICYGIMIPTMMDLSIGKMKLTQNIMKFY